MALGRLGLDNGGHSSSNASGGASSFGETSGGMPLSRRQLVDIIQTDFPRTPSPAILDPSGMRVRPPNTPLQRQVSADSNTVGNPHSFEGGILGSGQLTPASASAFSTLSASAPNRNPSLTSPSGLLSDTGILGMPVRLPSVVPPSRSHSTVLPSSNTQSHNVGMILNSLLDQEEDDDFGRHRSQIDIFGMSVGSPPGQLSGAPGQSLWAARHAARLDGLQRASSTPPRNAATVAATVSGPHVGATGAPGIWGGMDIGANQQQASGALLHDNGFMAYNHPGSLNAGPLSVSGAQMGAADDLNYRLRSLRLGDDSSRGIRSAELHGTHDVFGDADGSVSARASGPMSSVSDHWEFTNQHQHQQHFQYHHHQQQAQQQQHRLYNSNMPLQSQLRLHNGQPMGSAVGGSPFVDNIATDRNALYSGGPVNTAGAQMHNVGLAHGASPHGFTRAQSYNDNGRYVRGGSGGVGPMSAYSLPQPIAQRPTANGPVGAGVANAHRPQGGTGQNTPGQQQQHHSSYRIQSQTHTPQQPQQHQQHPKQHHHAHANQHRQQQHQQPLPQKQQQQQQQQNMLAGRDAAMYNTPPPSTMSAQPVAGVPKARGGSNSTAAAAVATSPEPGMRTTILEEFRVDKARKYELKDFCDHIVEFSCDQHGSRFIQLKLETAAPEDTQMVFSEILPSARQLMTDVFGNYVIQKLFEHGSQPQRHMLANQMEGHILTLSLQMYGCRVVQKALEHVLVEQQLSIVRELHGHVLQCVKDQNGNHVIQKAIERISADKIRFIIDSFHGQVYTLATHPYGCRVIQRMFEHCSESQTRPLLEELHRFTTNLVQDQYGNYVIQHVMERGKAVDRILVCSRVRGHVLHLSKHKFASNVVEKCIAYGEPKDRKALIEEVMSVRRDGTSNLVNMMKDQYANYVVQKMLDVVDGQQRDQILDKIQDHMAMLRKFTYGKHLITKVEKYLASKEGNAGGNSSVSASSLASSPVPLSADAEKPVSAASATNSVTPRSRA
ncbi:mRNA binding protein puf3 [Kickxella alabastrina]|uniref:mRNA binding protein puf3 n=1 Tax=Kickxella alabastrina TaxID=61397 RepID=A0ACC1IAT3_9FUNG|nr:mRNA binding protein puf3 [Kickxella alabastrina]